MTRSDTGTREALSVAPASIWQRLAPRLRHFLRAAFGACARPGPARRNVGTEDLVYTLISATRDRHAHNGSGTYAAFTDLRLAYPSTDHNVIFAKMHRKSAIRRAQRR